MYPAAGLIRYYRGNRLALINKSATPYDREAGLVINASLGEVLGAIRYNRRRPRGRPFNFLLKIDKPMVYSP